MQPYVFVKELMVIEEIFDIFGVIIELVISLEFAQVMLPLLSTCIKHVKRSYADRKDGNDSSYPRLLPCAFILQDEI